MPAQAMIPPGEMLASGFDKGEESEKRTAEALEELKREKRIKDYAQTLSFGKDDIKGIDFFVWIEEKKDPILLQVKSSYIPESKKWKYEKKGIQVVMVSQNKEEHQKNKERLLEAIFKKETNPKENKNHRSRKNNYRSNRPRRYQ